MKTHPFLRYAERARNRASLRLSLLEPRSTGRYLGLDSQALAALGAACVQDLAATTGSHACAEAVRALATDDGRLVSTFHGGLA